MTPDDAYHDVSKDRMEAFTGGDRGGLRPDNCHKSVPEDRAKACTTEDWGDQGPENEHTTNGPADPVVARTTGDWVGQSRWKEGDPSEGMRGKGPPKPLNRRLQTEAAATGRPGAKTKTPASGDEESDIRKPGHDRHCRRGKWLPGPDAKCGQWAGGDRNPGAYG